MWMKLFFSMIVKYVYMNMKYITYQDPPDYLPAALGLNLYTFYSIIYIIEVIELLFMKFFS